MINLTPFTLGKILKQPKDGQPGVIEVVINGTTVFCEYDNSDIVVQAGPGKFYFLIGTSIYS